MKGRHVEAKSRMAPGDRVLVCRTARDARKVEGGERPWYVPKSGTVETFLPAGASLRSSWAACPERFDRSDVSPFDRYLVRFEPSKSGSVSFGTPIASTVAKAPVKSA